MLTIQRHEIIKVHKQLQLYGRYHRKSPQFIHLFIYLLCVCESEVHLFWNNYIFFRSVAMSL